MATQSATFTFSLPEDVNSDQLLILSATSEGGTYSTAATVSYEYGTVTYEYDSLDDTKWYKIQFNNSVDSEAGPVSEAVFGGDFDNGSPFLAISTGTDGANYATNQDVYDASTLTSQDVSSDLVSAALRRSRALVDLRTAALDLDRFTRTFETPEARKKFNATLRIVREAEVSLALGFLYRGLSDDLVMGDVRDDTNDFASVSIGSTSLTSGGGSARVDHMARLLNLSERYMSDGEMLLNSIQPPSIRLHTEGEFVSSPKFKYPFNGY